MAAGEIHVSGTRLYWRNGSDVELSYEGTNPTAVADPPGTIWVDSSAFYYVDAVGNRRQFSGSVIGSGGTPGQIYIGTSNSWFTFTGTTGNTYGRSGS